MLVAVMTAACGSSQGSPSVSAAPSAAATVVPSGIETTEPVETLPEPTPPPLLEGQTDTEWGRIWDSLPSGFPTYPGSTISEEAATEAVSAVYVVAEEDIDAIVEWMQDALERAAYSTMALSGPLEDGSFIIDSVGQDAGCRLEVSIAPLGGTTSLTFRYGSDCPHD